MSAVLTRRQFALAGGAAAFGLGIPTSDATSCPLTHVRSIIPWDLVNPELRAPLSAFLGRFVGFGKFTWSNKELPTIRAGASKAAPPLATPTHIERVIPGLKGSPPVRVYVINAAGHKDPKPAILHMHGGGYIAGTAAGSIRPLQDVAKEHDCIIVTVDYRLAPEALFPDSLNDNYAALRWLYDNAEKLGVDRHRIAIMGESAGGGHAAELAIAARDRGEVPILLQVLIYPMLDDRTGSSRKLPPFIGKYMWTPEANRFGWTSLLGVPAGSASVPAGAVPARVKSVACLAPAFIGVGSIDLFAEEDIEYARRLILAGVPTELLVVPGAFHGFNSLAPDAAVSKEFDAAWNTALTRAFASKTAA